MQYQLDIPIIDNSFYAKPFTNHKCIVSKRKLYIIITSIFKKTFFSWNWLHSPIYQSKKINHILRIANSRNTTCACNNWVPSWKSMYFDSVLVCNTVFQFVSVIVVIWATLCTKSRFLVRFFFQVEEIKSNRQWFHGKIFTQEKYLPKNLLFVNSNKLK